MHRNYSEKEHAKEILFARFVLGIKKLFHNLWLLLIIGVTTVSLIAVGITRIISKINYYKMGRIIDATLVPSGITIIIPTILGLFIILCLLGTPLRAWKVDKMMKKISIRDGLGEPPFLLYFYKNYDGRIDKYVFESPGIPLVYYEDGLFEIEAALNASVVKIKQGVIRSRVEVYAVDYSHDVPVKVEWKQSRVSPEDFELNLGVGILGDVLVNLNKIPHILIGGSTGSGKTVLLQCLLAQSIIKGAEVYIADFKGGVDYASDWHDVAEIITDEDVLLQRLDHIVKVIEDRKKNFLEAQAKNITEYREKTNKECKRIIFSCDEVAELFDKSGLDKDAKERKGKIEGLISTIARQGRAFGVNLILATQRPDANVISGQIKNNIDYRICGRADDVLSKIVLDNTSASEEIPKYEQGLFINHEGTVFRGYI